MPLTSNFGPPPQVRQTTKERPDQEPAQASCTEGRSSSNGASREVKYDIGKQSSDLQMRLSDAQLQGRNIGHEQEERQCTAGPEDNPGPDNIRFSRLQVLIFCPDGLIETCRKMH